jgi:hypothetical protein
VRGITRISLGIMAAAFTSAAPSPVGAQGSGGTDVCALIDAAEVARITGRTPPDGQGPKANDASDFRRGERGCRFVDLQFVLVTPETRESFASTRKIYEDVRQPFKTQTVAGLGDEAYLTWDPTPGKYRPVMVAFRSGNKKVAIEDQTSSDSVEVMKKALVAIAKTVVPRMK